MSKIQLKLNINLFLELENVHQFDIFIKLLDLIFICKKN